MLNLDDRGVQISLTNGTAQVRLRQLDENDEFEVDTPQAAFTLLRTGEYRLSVPSGGGETAVIARSGQMEAIGPGQTFTVRAQQQARIRGTETVSYEINPSPPIDGFDDFCRTRDSRAERAESLKNVSPQVIGWEDLDEYGSWRVSATYGSVWYPRVIAPGWAPYRFGHWVWIWPWGWTWVDDAPWDSRRSTTGAGPISVDTGVGFPGPFMCEPCMHPPWSSSPVEGLDYGTTSASVVDLAWLGSRWARARSTFRRIAPAARTLQMSM